MGYDCVVIGGGAAGLTAAVLLGQAAHGRRRVLLLEKAPRPGKKLLATGNGTCNLTNTGAAPARYHGCPALAGAALAAFSPADTMAFFTSLGVDCRVREDGRVYPYSEQAAAVLDALRLETAALGVELCCQRPATALQRTNTGWWVITAAGAVETKAALVCTGGAAAPALGGSAEAYGLLTDLGLAKTPLFPSIVQLRTDTALVRAVKGIRVDAGVELRLDGAVQAQNTGEVLFTDYGLSGPAVMQVSRVAGDWERRQRGTLTAVLDLLPDWKLPMLEKRIGVRSRLPGRTLEDLLTGLLHKRVGQTVLRAAGVLPLTRPADTLTPAECHRAAALCKGWELPVLGTKGFGGAQVTAGGINARQIDPQTMGLRGFPGLFAAGEVLDVDGDCGGFNLQFAFSSAYVAATAIAAGWR